MADGQQRKFTRAKLSERKFTEPVESWSWRNCCS